MGGIARIRVTIAWPVNRSVSSARSLLDFKSAMHLNLTVANELWILYNDSAWISLYRFIPHTNIGSQTTANQFGTNSPLCVPTENGGATAAEIERPRRNQSRSYAVLSSRLEDRLRAQAKTIVTASE